MQPLRLLARGPRPTVLCALPSSGAPTRTRRWALQGECTDWRSGRATVLTGNSPHCSGHAALLCNECGIVQVYDAGHESDDD